MAFQHGVRVQEQATSIVAPITGTAGLQIVFGTAPVNLADDPYSVTNTPVIAYNWSEAVAKLGYSADWKKYTLCQSMYASFQLIGVAPVVFVNVLDPNTHKKTNETVIADVIELSSTITITGILTKTVTVSIPGEENDTPLSSDTDYLLSFDDNGYLVVTLTATGAGATAAQIKV